MPETETALRVPPDAGRSPWGRWVAVALLTVVLAGGAFYYTAFVMPGDEFGLPDVPTSTPPETEASGDDGVPTAEVETVEAEAIQVETIEVETAEEFKISEILPAEETIEAVIQPADSEIAVDEQTSALEAKRLELEAQAQEAARQQDVLVQELLEEAHKDFLAGRVVGARERYAVVLSLEPENATALSGYERLFVKYLELAVTALGAQRFEPARQHLENAQTLGLHPERVIAARAEVEAARVEWERVQRERRKTEETTLKLQAEIDRQREEQAAREQAQRDQHKSKVKVLLVEGADHLSALRLTSPSGANAFETYVAVLRMEPDNESAITGLQEIARRYRALAGSAADDGQFEKARGYLTRAIDRLLTGVPDKISQTAGAAIDKSVSDLRATKSQVHTREQEAERFAAEEQRRAQEEADERQRATEEAARLAALIKERDDLDRQRQELELAQEEALAKEQILNARRARYDVVLTAAQRAEDAFDRNLAISKYTEALSIFPEDPVARNGLARVRDSAFGTCGVVTGKWRYSTGGLVTLNQNGTAKHELVVVFNATGTWECVNPARREIKITWNTGFTDLLTVMPGARRVEGKNNLGMPVWGDRE